MMKTKSLNYLLFILLLFSALVLASTLDYKEAKDTEIYWKTQQ